MAVIIAFGNPVYDDITTPTVTTGGRVLSGCSTNGCLALARLGHSTGLVGTIGDDYQQRFVSDLQRYNVVGYVRSAAQTGGFRLVYDDRGDRTLDVLGIAAPIEHVPDICARADAIIIGPILQETPYRLVEQIKAVSDAPLYLDPQGLMRRIGSTQRIEHYADPIIAQLAPLCHVIKANEVEARVLTGIDPREDAAAAVRALKTLGSHIAIVTIAEAGSIIDDGINQWRIPAYRTVAHDPTGAGDTYMAGFIHGHLQRPTDLFYAGVVGSATASIWIEHTGPDAPISLDEVLRRTEVLLASKNRE
jgi:sugar/nucleoside kinase (ribokinase family)